MGLGYFGLLPYFFWKLFPMCEDGRCHGLVTNAHSVCKTQALGSLARPHVRVLRRPREGKVKEAEPGKVPPCSVSLLAVLGPADRGL